MRLLLRLRIRENLNHYVRPYCIGHERTPPNQFLLWVQLEACQRDFPKEPGRFRQVPDCPKAISREQEAGAPKSVAARKIMSIANIKADDRSVQVPVARTRRVAGANFAYTNKIAMNLKCDATISQQIAK